MVSTKSSPFLNAYIEAYGPLSGAEYFTPLDRASEIMLFLNRLIDTQNPYLALNKNNDLIITKDFKLVDKSQLNLIKEKTTLLIVYIINCHRTLPVLFQTKDIFQSVAEKERKLCSMYHLLTRSLDLTFSKNESISPLKSYKFSQRHFEIGKKQWVHEGAKVDVLILGSFLFSQGGLGLKISLKSLDEDFAEASFYEHENTTCVIDIKSFVKRDSLTHRYQFIEMITHIIFNVWEKEETDSLSLFYRVSYYSSANLGFNFDHLDLKDEWVQEIQFTRSLACSHFDYFKKIVDLPFSIVPINRYNA